MRMAIASGSIPRLLRNDRAWTPVHLCISKMKIHCNIIILHISIKLSWAYLMFSYCFMLLIYLFVVVWVHCQLPWYDTEFLATKLRYIWRFGLKNCEIYGSYNECVFHPIFLRRWVRLPLIRTQISVSHRFTESEVSFIYVITCIKSSWVSEGTSCDRKGF